MIRKLMRSQSGASLVEFALLVPVMAFLLVGIIDIGRYTFYAILAANAARAGAQFGAQNLSTAENTAGMVSAAKTDGQNFAQWDGVTANYLCSVSGAAPAPCTSGSSTPPTNTIYYVQVIVTGHFTPLVKYPGIPSNGTTGIPITGSATMRVISQ